MKCIACSNDVLYPDRQDGKCPKCGHRFAFEPRKGDKLSDAAFQGAIERVSSGHSVKWTKEHLYYELARRTRSGSKVGAAILGVVGGVFALAGFAEAFFFVLTLAAWTIAVVLWPSSRIRLKRTDFEGLWRRWTQINGQPRGLIVRKEAPAPVSRKGKLPSDIAAYSFDRAVVTDRPETADLLLANNFHFENNCAVLCVSGYPERAFDTVLAMLRNNPKLVVYALHDATPEGCALARRLSQSEEWFRGRARVVDVGLRPGHAGPFKGCWQEQTRQVPADPALSGSELRFLTKYYVDLAVIRPEQTIKRLFRAISRKDDESAPVAGDGGGSGDAGYDVDSASFSDDAGASDGGGDSFG